MFVSYLCPDCLHQHKEFALSYKVHEFKRIDEEHLNADLEILKIGEVPRRVSRINPKVKRLLEDHWDLYRKGANCEADGHGIGAFAYYRRVVELSRDMIVDQICKVAESQSQPEKEVNKIRALKSTKEFSKAADAISKFIPMELRIEGRNPLSLLFGPISDGLHNRSDDECLKLAQDIRTLLDTFGEKLQFILDNQDRVRDAIASLEGFSKSEDATPTAMSPDDRSS